MATPILVDGCFGWLHPGGSRRGAVLCSPFGQEAEFTHREWRDLAEALAKAGLTTLRFDYAGLGDSPGDDEQPSRLATWVGNVRAAIQRLRDDYGVQEVVLIGLRFGAALAAAAAREEAGIEGVALLAPVGSGAGYIRELTMTARIAHKQPVREGEEISVAGVTYTRETLDDFSRFRPFSGGPPPPRVLTLTPPGLPPDGAVAAWAAAGTAEQGEFEGYSEFMFNADYNVYPAEAFGRVVRWAATGLPAQSGAPAITPEQPIHLDLTDSREEVVAIPGTAPLFGVFSEPKRPLRDAPAVLFMNTGATSHQGAGRMWVAMARKFAAMGFASLRFDVAGVGDSPDRPDQVDPVEQVSGSLVDVRAALDLLEARGHPRAILAGFCRGSQLACLTAFADRRVCGQVLIGPPVYFWDEPPLHGYPRSAGNYVQLVKNPETWAGVLRGEIRPWQLVRGAGRMARRWVDQVQQKRKAMATAARIRQLAGRGVETFMIVGDRDDFLPGVEEYFFSRIDRFPRLLSVRTAILPETDHLYLTKRDRELLIGTISPFVAEFGAGPPKAAQGGNERARRPSAPAADLGGEAAA